MRSFTLSNVPFEKGNTRVDSITLEDGVRDIARFLSRGDICDIDIQHRFIAFRGQSHSLAILSTRGDRDIQRLKEFAELVQEGLFDNECGPSTYTANRAILNAFGIAEPELADGRSVMSLVHILKRRMAQRPPRPRIERTAEVATAA